MLVRSPIGVAVVMLSLAAVPAVARAQGCQIAVTAWGGAGDDWIGSALTDPQGGFYCIGGTSSYGQGGEDVLLLDLDSNRTQRWAKTWGGPNDDWVDGRALDTSAGGGFYAAGATDTVTLDALLIKFDLAGAVLWAKRWDSGNDDHTEALARDTAGNMVIAGGTGLNAGPDDVLLLSFAPTPGAAAPTGPVLAKRWGGADDDGVNAAMIDESSGTAFLYVVGNTRSFGNGSHDVLVQKYDANLVLIWSRTWGGVAYDDAYGMAVDSTGDLYVVGSTRSFGAGADDALIMKWSGAGVLHWALTWGAVGGDEVGGVVVDELAGDVYVTGCSGSFSGAEDALLIKVSTAGQFRSAHTWGGGQSDGFGFPALAADRVILPGATGGGAALVVRSGSHIQNPGGAGAVGTQNPAVHPSVPIAGNLADHVGASSSPAPGSGGGSDAVLVELRRAASSFSAACPAAPHAFGGPVVSVLGAPGLGSTFGVRGDSLAGSSISALLIGVENAPLSLAAIGSTVAGSALCVTPFARVLTGFTSTSTVSLAIPSDSTLCGATLACQWIDWQGVGLDFGTSAVANLLIAL